MSIRREDIAGVNFDDVAEAGRLEPVRPGEVLREEFMVPLGLTARALAREIDRPANRITAILQGKRGITAETAILLGRRFNTSPRFWLNLQVNYDLLVAERHMSNAAFLALKGSGGQFY